MVLTGHLEHILTPLCVSPSICGSRRRGGQIPFAEDTWLFLGPVEGRAENRNSTARALVEPLGIRVHAWSCVARPHGAPSLSRETGRTPPNCRTEPRENRPGIFGLNDVLMEPPVSFHRVKKDILYLMNGRKPASRRSVRTGSPINLGS